MTSPIPKRWMDISISFILLIFLLPIMAVIFIIMSFESGPLEIIFFQKRIGKNGRIFTIYKFRTLRLSFSKLNKIGHEFTDSTITGRFLRKYSLDELPQLVNVLRGDMSLVGPRPLPMEYMTYINENFAERNSVKPGLVCFSHLYGRNNLDWKHRFRWDIFYLKTRSWWVDLYILFNIPFIIFKGEGNILSPKLVGR